MDRSLVLSFLALTALLSAVSCGGGDERGRRSGRESAGGGGAGGAPAALITFDPGSGGIIAGKILYDGEAPKRDKIRFSEPVCQEPWGEQDVLKEDVVVGPGGGVAYAMVYIEVSDKYVTPTAPVELDQKGCMYDPHVLTMQAGQAINVKNSDNTLHNVHWMAFENPETNFAMPKPGVETKKLEYAEVPVKVKCDVHPWMGAWIGVFDHPFHTVSGEDGSFSFPAPEGTHTVKVWTEACGTYEARVTVTRGQTANAEFKVVKK